MTKREIFLVVLFGLDIFDGCFIEKVVKRAVGVLSISELKTRSMRLAGACAEVTLQQLSLLVEPKPLLAMSSDTSFLRLLIS